MLSFLLFKHIKDTENLPTLWVISQQCYFLFRSQGISYFLEIKSKLKIPSEEKATTYLSGMCFGISISSDFKCRSLISLSILFAATTSRASSYMVLDNSQAQTKDAPAVFANILENKKQGFSPPPHLLHISTSSSLKLIIK